MSYNTKPLKLDGNRLPAPQYYNSTSDEYEVQQGKNGAANVALTGSNVQDGLSVTPSDTTDLSKGASKGIYLGVAGNVKVDLASGATITFTSLGSGMIHPISAKRIYATGTTATNIVAVY